MVSWLLSPGSSAPDITVALSLVEFSSSTDNLAETLAECVVTELWFSNLGVVYLVFGVEVLVVHDFGDLVHGVSDFEDVRHEVVHDALLRAVVGLVEAESEHFELELVDAAELLELETNLEGLSGCLENTNIVSWAWILWESHDIFIGGLAHAILGDYLAVIFVEALSKTAHEAASAVNEVLHFLGLIDGSFFLLHQA